MSPEKIGRYEILTELGRGGMATVYKAHDPRFKRDVAVKILPASFTNEPTFRARFEREAQTIAALEFPGIVPVYDFGDQDGQPYLVMRYMQGGSLYLKLRQGPLSLVESSRMITRLGGALDYVHSKGIIHRDLKPANILFDQFATAYLSDFGIARLQEASIALTGDGMIGTPAYMSPEQARGETDIDGRSDIYSLGTIIFEMLTGKQPYEATTPMGVAMKHVLEPVPRILTVRSDLPEPCEALILRAMAKNRDERYQSAVELSGDLVKIAASSVEPPAPTVADEVIALTPEAARPVPPPPSPIPSPLPSTRLAAVEQIRQATPAPSDHPEPPAPLQQTPLVQQPEQDITELDIEPSSAPPDHRVPAAPASQIPATHKTSRKSFLTTLGIGGLVLVCVLLFAFFALRGVRSLKTFLYFRDSVLNPAPTQTLAGEQSAESVQPPPPGTIIFHDDFADPNSGWERFDNETGLRNYDGGVYRFLVGIPNHWFISTPPPYFADVDIRVDVTKIAGPGESFFGIICRFQNLENYYFLIISGDGRYGIGKSIKGSPEFIGQDRMIYNDHIQRGDTANLMHAICAGNRLVLFVNDTELAIVEDPTFKDGKVGLVAGNGEFQGANIVFDNFIVAQP